VIRLVLRRLLQLPLVLVGISAVIFGVMALLPGDPALAILGPHATPERMDRLREELGLDQPLPARYATWVSHVVRGDLGHSVSLERPVAAEVAERGRATALLAAAALALCVALGLPAGAWAAWRQGRWPDRAVTVTAVVGLSTPPFWLAMLVMLLFAVWLGWLPVSGMTATVGGGGALDVARHLVLPAATLSAVAAAVVARVSRTAMLEVRRREFLRVVRAKGVRECRVVSAHALPSALVQIVPVIGLQAGYVIGGAVYVETVFQWPGLGRMLVEAVQSRDVVLVQGGALVMATAYVLVNLGADLVQAWLDPRLRS
jgi:peptide/nickel transport system permease protein